MVPVLIAGQRAEAAPRTAESFMPEQGLCTLQMGAITRETQE